MHLVTTLAVALLHLPYPASCSNIQRCLKLPTYYCTSLSTMPIDVPDHHVIIIAVTDLYTGFLSVPVSISSPCPFVVPSGCRAVREDRGVCNSFTTVPNLTKLIVRKHRRLLVVILWFRLSGLSDKP